MDAHSRRNGQSLYNFGEFTLDVPDRRLTSGVCAVHLTPKTYNVLLALVSRAGHLVTKSELLDRVWPGVFVDEGVLTVYVAALRKAVGDTRESPAYIETVSGSGCRFVATVRHASTAEAARIERSACLDGEVQR